MTALLLAAISGQQIITGLSGLGMLAGKVSLGLPGKLEVGHQGASLSSSAIRDS